MEHPCRMKGSLSGATTKEDEEFESTVQRIQTLTWEIMGEKPLGTQAFQKAENHREEHLFRERFI
jgi:hypothetical protein